MSSPQITTVFKPVLFKNDQCRWSQYCVYLKGQFVILEPLEWWRTTSHRLLAIKHSIIDLILKFFLNH